MAHPSIYSNLFTQSPLLYLEKGDLGRKDGRRKDGKREDGK